MIRYFIYPAASYFSAVWRYLSSKFLTLGCRGTFCKVIFELQFCCRQNRSWCGPAGHQRWASCQTGTVLTPFAQPLFPLWNRIWICLPFQSSVEKEPRYPSLDSDFFCLWLSFFKNQKAHLQIILVPSTKGDQAVFASIRFKLCQSMLDILFEKMMSKTCHQDFNGNKL